MSIIITLIIFTVIVVIHEGGHFAAAKSCKVFVEEFAVGMGPKLFGIKRGDTLYSVRFLPIGGYCKMADEKPEDSNKKGFNEATVLERIFISAAGPVMNFVLALLILAFITMATGAATNVITGTMEGYPAAEAGLKSGDVICAINGKAIHSKSDLSFYLTEYAGEEMQFTIKREGEKFQVPLGLKQDEKGRYLVGITTEYKAPLLDLGIYDKTEDFMQLPKTGFFESITYGFWQMIFLVKITVAGVIKMLTFNVPMSEISGPIGVTSVVGETYRTTMQEGGSTFTALTMFNLGALLSANLGVINLVPIPALDGGRILVYLIEIVRRKKLPPEKEGIINLIGFALVMGFGIFIAVKDVLKLI